MSRSFFGTIRRWVPGARTQLETPNLLTAGLDMVASLAFSAFARSVTYRSASGQRVTLKAIPSDVRSGDIQTQGRARLAVLERDYICKFIDLRQTPAQQDRILDGSEVWEVQRTSSETAGSYCDPYKRLIRIHTKKVVNG